MSEHLFVNKNFNELRIKDDDMLVFFHAQRTGGSALRHVLARAYGEDSIFCTQYVDDFKHWEHVSAERLSSMKIFAGHSNFMEREMGRNLHFISLLRHPVYRIISLYYYCQKHQKHPLHDFAMNQDILGFYRNSIIKRSYYLNNLMCSRICGEPNFEMAKEYIESKYLAVGLTDQLGDFVHWLLSSQHIEPEVLESIEHDSIRYADIIKNEKMVREIKEGNSEDVALFEYMNSRYFKMDGSLYP